jgi:acyl-CoA thioester hydrolase
MLVSMPGIPASLPPVSDDWPFSHVDQVRYADLDTNRHLNNVAVHQFFEGARVAYIRGLLPELDPLGRESEAFGMIFAETHVRFRSPGFYEDELRTHVRVEELKRSSVRIAFKSVCEGDGRLVADGWGTLVGYDYDAGRSAPLPAYVAERLREAGRG